ncbi:MAG TPA: hypothetical protein VF177_08525 [Anaerolineae bacterium]
MKTQVDLVKVLAICLILLSLMLLAGCQASTPVQAAVTDASAPAADFDYEQAAEVSAARWQAMAGFYQANDMLNFDTEQAAEVSAARWQALARFYEQAGLLTRPQTVGFATAINPADQKFFNAGYGISARANSDVLSAADSADRKFLNGAYGVSAGATNVLSAADSADSKFFNAGVPNSVPATIHPADRKFFYTGGLYDTASTIQPAGRKSFYDGALYPVGH